MPHTTDDTVRSKDDIDKWRNPGSNCDSQVQVYWVEERFMNFRYAVGPATAILPLKPTRCSYPLCFTSTSFLYNFSYRPSNRHTAPHTSSPLRVICFLYSHSLYLSATGLHSAVHPLEEGSSSCATKSTLISFR